VIDGCGFAHFLADARFAPLDAELFQYRRRTGAVAVPMLAAASLLSKKLAVGIRTVGLDVRVGPHGNFGATFEAARVNARLFCEAAALLGMQATAFLTGGTGPVQPFIGRGEALTALAHACGIAQVEQNEWLSEHVRDCIAMTEITVASSGAPAPSCSTPNVSSADLLSVLTAHLRAQGSSIDVFESKVHAVLAADRTQILAPSDGLITIDLDLIRSALVKAQEHHAASAASFADPAGLQLLVRPGKAVRKGDILALLRWETMMTPTLPEEIALGFKIVSKEGDLDGHTGGMEIIHG
jgi:thymidine phosphorylase